MQGRINGIWLTSKNGKLHPAIHPNLSSWAQDTLPNRFEVALWTNTNELLPEEVKKLEASNIKVKDHSLCKASPFYKYFLFFLNQGIAGDKTAFALASDILRMAILGLTSADKYFIYADPNDIEFLELGDHLKRLDANMSKNRLGLSFYAAPLINEKGFHFRNDVLIAKKSINPAFFQAYLTAYCKHIHLTHQLYIKPTTNEEAQALAAYISNQITPDFFDTTEEGILIAKFGKVKQAGHFIQYEYQQSVQSLHCGNFLNWRSIRSHGNTWLPIACLNEEKEWLRKASQYQEITGTCSHTEILKTIYKINFKAVMDSNYNVDALFEKNNTESEVVCDELESYGIYTKQTLFNEKEYIVISNINSTAIAGKIQSMLKK